MLTRFKRLHRITRLLLISTTVFLLGTACLALAGLRDDLAPADVGLVLGSKVELDGRPSTRLRARLDRTLELYRAGYFPWVITSGGFGKEGYDEAVVMRDYLVAGGIPPDRVIVDGHGDNTFESAKNTRRIVQGRNLKSVLVVTQYFHIPRSRLALRRFQISEVHSAHARIYEFRDTYSALRESFGYLAYLVRSYREK
ncbi:MAG: YdcF family protein [Verrucomicrobia bacterium]|nr:YdcF family protein [Verrucomicrobiota bacterium]